MDDVAAIRKEFSYPIIDLPPTGSINLSDVSDTSEAISSASSPVDSARLNDVCDTSEADGDSYRIVGVVLHDPTATDPASASVSAVPEGLLQPAVGGEIYPVNSVTILAP